MPLEHRDASLELLLGQGIVLETVVEESLVSLQVQETVAAPVDDDHLLLALLLRAFGLTDRGGDGVAGLRRADMPLRTRGILNKSFSSARPPMLQPVECGVNWGLRRTRGGSWG